MLRRFLSTTCTPFHLNSKYSTILRRQNVNQNPAFPTKMKISWLSTTGVQRLKCFNSESLQKRVGIINFSSGKKVSILNLAKNYLKNFKKYKIVSKSF